MAIPVFQNPPNSFLNTANLVNAALNLYRQGRAGGTLTQNFYEDNNLKQCVTDVANSILHYVDQLRNGVALDHGAQIGTLPNGHILLHASFTHHGTGNCSIICEYVPGRQPIGDRDGATVNVHAIGAHQNNYRYDGVSNVLHPLLEQNRLAGRGVRYTNAQRDTVQF